jgi:tetratricopeptide (TPR) repeat protein
MAFIAILTAFPSIGAWAQADQQLLENARRLLNSGNPKQAFQELSAQQDKLSGMPEFDYLLGVSALDSGRIDDAIIAFERVLAVNPSHAGAQMDLARAYYAAGSFDLAEAAFRRLRDQNPPPAALIAINRYLDAIQARKLLTQAGWSAYSELGLGWDSNLTGVPGDFGAAANQSFGISGIVPTGNAVKRSAWFAMGALGGEYHYPLSRGWSLFAGGEARGRAYHKESDFNIEQGEVHGGAALNAGDDQYRATAVYMPFNQKGDAPGDPQPTNDRRITGINLDWRHALNTKMQAGFGLQVNSIRFPTNKVEDFNQLFLSASWLQSFEGKGSPLLYLTGFVSDDRALHSFDNGVNGTSTKSKNLLGARSYFQYSINPKLQVYNGLGVIYRRDKDDYARSTEVQHGHDTYGEATFGVGWQFREKCALRVQFLVSTNNSDVDIYDFNRNEFSSTIRCDLT